MNEIFLLSKTYRFIKISDRTLSRSPQESRACCVELQDRGRKSMRVTPLGLRLIVIIVNENPLDLEDLYSVRYL